MRKRRRRFFVGGKIRVAGWVFYLVAGLVLLAAFNTGTNLLYLVLAGLVSFIVLSAIISGWNIRRVRLVRESPQAVHRDQPFLVQVRVENHRRLFPAVAVRIAPADDIHTTRAYLLKLPARRAAVVQVREVFSRRGVHRMPDYAVASSFPFGLLERSRVHVDDREVLVYPRVSSVRTTAIDRQPGRNYMTRSASPDGDEFFGLREYIPGDDMRHIAWRISARLGTWMIREWSRDNSRMITFALDTTRSAADDFEEQFEEAVELVASLAVTMLHRHYIVGIATVAAQLAPAEGAAQERRILELLARATPSDKDDFAVILQELETSRAAVVCVSADPGRWGGRTHHGRRFIDPREVIHA